MPPSPRNTPKTRPDPLFEREENHPTAKGRAWVPFARNGDAIDTLDNERPVPPVNDGCGCLACRSEHNSRLATYRARLLRWEATQQQRRRQRPRKAPQNRATNFFREACGFNRLPVERYVAVELEIATTASPADNINDVVYHWGLDAKRDGSVPNGVEITTPPAMGDDFVSMIKALGRAFDQDHARVDSTCGFHVHVDARDVDLAKMRRLIRVWAHIEKMAYLVQPPSRRNNTYCRRNFLDVDLKTLPVVDVCRVIGGGDPYVDYHEYSSRLFERAPERRGFSALPGGDRYRGMNLQALRNHGTIEFRLHSGTTNARKIISWAATAANIVDWSFGASDPEVARFLKMNPWTAFLSLAPTREAASLLVARRRKFSRAADPQTAAPDLSGAVTPLLHLSTKG